MAHNESLPPSDRDETASPAPRAKSAVKLFPCNTAIRDQLRAMRDAPDSIWSNAEIGNKLGVTSAVISQWLHDDGCKYNVQGGGREGVSLESKANDFLQALARRRASGIETINDADVAEDMCDQFNLIRKTNDLGAVIGPSGKGKTRGIEVIKKNNPLAIVIEIAEWCAKSDDVQHAIWSAIPHDGYAHPARRFPWAVEKMRGTDRPFIFDDAHKLCGKALSLVASFQEKTGCPVVLVGMPDLVKKLEADPQLYSRVGIAWTIMADDRKTNKKVVLHTVRSIAKDVNGDLDELVELCHTVARHHGSLRAVRKQLLLAAELRHADDDLSWPQAFRQAHTHLLRPYSLDAEPVTKK